MTGRCSCGMVVGIGLPFDHPIWDSFRCPVHRYWGETVGFDYEWPIDIADGDGTGRLTLDGPPPPHNNNDHDDGGDGESCVVCDHNRWLTRIGNTPTLECRKGCQ